MRKLYRNLCIVLEHKYPLTCLTSQQQVCYQQWTYFAPMLIGVIQSLELESDLKLKLKQAPLYADCVWRNAHHNQTLVQSIYVLYIFERTTSEWSVL